MNDIQIVEYNNIRVLTTQQVAEAYGTDRKVISNNFNRNKDRYVEGKHYISLPGEEKKKFLNCHQFEDGLKNAGAIYLWTQKGCLLHVKSLNTDIAWEVYDKLVDEYFDKSKTSAPLTTSGQIRLLAQGYTELEQKVDTVERKVEYLEKDIPLYGSEADELCNHVKRKGVVVMGGKASNSYKDTKIRSAVYTDIYNQIKREFGLYDDKGRFTSYKALKRRYIYEAHELIDSYVLPTYLEERIENSNVQLNMEVA